MRVFISGAGRGIGRAMAGAMAARGDAVQVSVRRAGDAPEGCRAHLLDVTDAAAWEALNTGPLDLLVCNAGVLVSRGGIDDPDFSNVIRCGWDNYDTVRTPGCPTSWP